jgi:signal transduction histidine kinase
MGKALELDGNRQLGEPAGLNAKAGIHALDAGGIAHDFNNLLGIIIGNLDMLEPFVAEDELRLEQLQDAQKAALRGSELTRRLLAFAKMEGLKPSATPLIPLIESTIKLVARALGPQIRIATRYDPSLLVVYVDAAGLESALLNLVVNARDAMPHGGTITIGTRLSTREEAYPKAQTGEVRANLYACLSVTDTGHGMTPEVAERAFEPFFTTKPGNKGTGLGLATVYGFVKQSGGTVRIYSELGIGTTLALYFPVPADHPHMPDAPLPASPSPANVTGTIAVVDDEADLLKIAVAYLKAIRCKVLQAQDGISGLEVVKRGQGIDLVLSDIIMPGIPG